MKSLFAALLLCTRICMLPAEDAASYFVSARGSDGNSGLSETSPFKTLARAVTTVQNTRNDSSVRTITILGVLDGTDEPVIDPASVFCIKDSGPVEITIRGKNGAKLLGPGPDFILAGDPPEMRTAGGDLLDPDYSDGKRVISVTGDSRIRFADIEISRGITGENGGGLLVSRGASVIMESGSIRSNAAYWGGGVNVTEHASFILRGGSIRGNTAFMGSGAAFNRAACLVEGGSIAGNAGIRGGGLYSAYGSMVAFTGGEIANNNAFDYGGGIAVHEASLTMAGTAALRNNRAGKGAGMFISHGELPGQGVVMYGGVIENNETDGSGGSGSYNGGGGVYNDGIFEMRGGVIGRNRAIGDYYTGRGGGIFLARGKRFFFFGGRIEENHAEKEGGGIYADTGSITECIERIRSAAIVKNSAAYGGGIYIQRASVIIRTGSIAENRALYCGGGVDVDGGIFEMRGGEISGNIVEESRTTVQGKVFRRSDKQGGGVFLERGGTFRLYKGALSRNMAGFGDAVMVNRGTVFEMYGGEIKDSEGMPVVVEQEGRFEKTGGDIDGQVIRLTDDN
jgi:predicted outer membrane repeat protein